MEKNRSPGGTFASRIIALFASLFFSVPTAAFVWLGVNKQLALWGSFIDSSYLIACVVAFAIMALLLPKLFPSILGGIWRWIIKVERWWGW